MWKPDEKDMQLVRRALFGAALFAGLEVFDDTPDVIDAAMIGALAFPLIGMLMNRQPIFLALPDVMEVNHVGSVKTVKAKPAQQKEI
jgi:hypothetical protein